MGISEAARNGLGFEAHAAPKLGAIVHFAVRGHMLDVANVVDGFKRIAVHKDQIGAFSRFDGADFPMERMTGKPEVIGSNSQFLVYRPTGHKAGILGECAR